MTECENWSKVYEIVEFCSVNNIKSFDKKYEKHCNSKQEQINLYTYFYKMQVVWHLKTKIVQLVKQEKLVFLHKSYHIIWI